MSGGASVFYERDIAAWAPPDQHDALVDDERKIRTFDDQLPGGGVIGPRLLLHAGGGLELKREGAELDHVTVGQIRFTNLLTVDIHMRTAGQVADVNFSLVADEQRMGFADLSGKQMKVCVVARTH